MYEHVKIYSGCNRVIKFTLLISAWNQYNHIVFAWNSGHNVIIYGTFKNERKSYFYFLRPKETHSIFYGLNTILGQLCILYKYRDRAVCAFNYLFNQPQIQYSTYF